LDANKVIQLIRDNASGQLDEANLSQNVNNVSALKGILNTTQGFATDANIALNAA
jgi:hypothetical protein